jgi:hypothetical protein
MSSIGKCLVRLVVIAIPVAAALVPVAAAAGGGGVHP